jgi:hypothetical protein
MADASARRTKSADLATAHHEAGHAVAAWQRKGLKAVRDISIEPRENYAGFSRSESLLKRRDPELDSTGATRDRLEDQIIVCLSGKVAQQRFNRHSVRDYHSRSDRQGAILLAGYVGGEGQLLEAYLRWMNLRTEAFVSWFWPAVADLAETLVDRRRMTGKELQQWFHDWDFRKLRRKAT